MIKSILTDIEGTTTSIDFVHKTLFPYSLKKIPEFLRSNNNNIEVQKYLEFCIATIADERRLNRADISLDLVIDSLCQWIHEDRKHTGLKGIQGMIWKSGYELGAYRSHIYLDVIPMIQKWTQAGLTVNIFSSGSVDAQKLLFRYTEYGNLTPLISNYFDTTIGKKSDPQSYQNILNTLDLNASDCMFLSDTESELDAAASTGFHTHKLVRGPDMIPSNHSIATTFTDISLF